MEHKILPQYPDYVVYENGTIFSLTNMKVLLPQKDGRKGEYRKVMLRVNNTTVQIKVHILVCKAFHPNPENKRTVNHKDNVKHNNHKNNLEWATHKENEQHKLSQGLGNHSKGFNHQKSKPVKQFSLSGEYITTHPCLREASKAVTGETHNSSLIIKVCKGQQKTAYGFTWQYA